MRIDHNPHEKRPTNAVWWALWLIVAIGWVGYFWFNTPDWWGICGGFMTGCALAAWAIEITGNKPFGSRRD